MNSQQRRKQRRHEEHVLKTLGVRATGSMWTLQQALAYERHSRSHLMRPLIDPPALTGEHKWAFVFIDPAVVA